MKARKKELSPLLFIPAAIFLFNPNINLLDILPDFIGYLFIMRALAGIDELVPHFDAARRGFLKLFWIALAKIPAYFIMAALVGDSTDGRVTITLFALSFGIAEIVFSFGAIAELFEGIYYLRARHGLLSGGERIFDDARTAAYVFAVARPVLAFLPELTYLSMYEHFGYVDNKPDIVLYRPFFIAVAVLFGLGFGIYFLVCTIRTARFVNKESGLNELLTDIRRENLPPLRGAARIRRIRLALSLLAIGFLCLIDLVFDEINYLPNGVAIPFFAVAALLLYTFAKREAIATLIACVPAAVLSVIASVLRFSFFAQYSYAALGKLYKADALYADYKLFSALEAGAQILLFAAVLWMLIGIIRAETGFEAVSEANRRSHAALHRGLTVRAAVLCALGVLSSVAMTADVFLRYYTDNYEQGSPMGENISVTLNGVALPIYGWFWLVVLALRIITAGVALLFVPFNSVFALIGFVVIGLGCAPIYPCIIHMTPSVFGEDKSQAMIGVQMAFAYTGFLIMPTIFGVIADYISISLLPVYLLVLLAAMFATHEFVAKKSNQ